MTTTNEQLGDPAELAHAVHRSNEQHGIRLDRILKALETNVVEIAVGGSPNDRLLENWPVIGRHRYSVSDRRAQGNDGLPIPAQASPATLVVEQLIGRLGGLIVNAGANPCTLYLCGVNRVSTGVAATWLAANGGSWDFRMGAIPWGGSVSAVSPLGTTLVVAQV